METIILPINDIKAIVRHVGLDHLMDTMIERLHSAFRLYDPAKNVTPARAGFHYTEPQLGLIEWMPIMKVGKSATVKTVGYHPANPTLRNMPTILATVSVYDTTSGHLIGLADATFLTALRTGAASAVASKLLASNNAKVVGLIGCGAQDITQLHALSRLYDIRKVLVYDITSTVCSSFMERAFFLGLHIVEVNATSLHKMVETADILCTATSVEIGDGPVFEDTETGPWLHVNAVGSDIPGKTELPLSLLKQSTVCPDFPEQAIKEGECQQLDAGEIGPTLVELAQNETAYTSLKQQRTVFDSTGWALEDQVGMELLMDYAMELGLGTLVQIEKVSMDPRDPYQFIREDRNRLSVSGIV